MSSDDCARAPQDLAEAARLERERLGRPAEERARALEGLTLEQLHARWADVTGPGGERASLGDFKVEAMAIYRAIGSKAGERVEALRAGGFDGIEPMQ